jgi:hypothetical protein
VDFRVDRPFHFGSVIADSGARLFNLTNSNTRGGDESPAGAPTPITVSGILRRA